MTEFLDVLKDDDLELKRLRPTFDLASTVFEIVDRNRECFGRWLPWVESTKTIEDEYDGLQHVYNNEWTYLVFLDNKIVGSVGFVKRELKRKKLEVGYWLDEDFGGRGIMTRAVKLLEEMVFQTDEWNKIEIHADVDNVKSQNVPKRLGYNLDGILRQDYFYPDGRIGDTMVFSKLRSECK